MAKQNKQSETQHARVLGGFTLDGVQYEPNDVIEAHPDIIESMGNSVDADPLAVEYCLGLESAVIKRHEWTPPAPAHTAEQTEQAETTETTDAADTANS